MPSERHDETTRAVIYALSTHCVTACMRCRVLRTHLERLDRVGVCSVRVQYARISCSASSLRCKGSGSSSWLRFVALGPRPLCCSNVCLCDEPLCLLLGDCTVCHGFCVAAGSVNVPVRCAPPLAGSIPAEAAEPESNVPESLGCRECGALRAQLM